MLAEDEWLDAANETRPSMPGEFLPIRSSSPDGGDATRPFGRTSEIAT